MGAEEGDAFGAGIFCAHQCTGLIYQGRELTEPGLVVLRFLLCGGGVDLGSLGGLIEQALLFHQLGFAGSQVAVSCPSTLSRLYGDIFGFRLQTLSSYLLRYC